MWPTSHGPDSAPLRGSGSGTNLSESEDTSEDLKPLQQA
jgi:hypothetical protein